MQEKRQIRKYLLATPSMIKLVQMGFSPTSLVLDKSTFVEQSMQMVRYSAIVGFIAATTLVINLHNKLYLKVFKNKAKSYFWFFLLLSIIPLLVFLYIFNALFQKLSLKV
jgi:hypothetical protein